MKKILFASLLIALFLTASAYSQDENQKADWQRFEPAQEEFSVEFPQKVSEEKRFDEKGVPEQAFYKVLFNKTYFFAFSGGDKNFLIPELVKKFMRPFQPAESEKKVGKLSGVVYTFRDDEDFYHRFFEIRTARRAYIFHTISESKDDSEAERFFDSIKFAEQAVGKNETTRFENPVAPEKPDKAVVAPGIQTGAGNGNGTGGGADGGSGNGSSRRDNTANPAPAQTLPVRFLSKPRAYYTDLARTYDITGEVFVRLTLQADGQIGAIVPVRRLPLGLTKAAMEAARQVRFEPAVRDGKPFSVTKIVIYSFTLY